MRKATIFLMAVAVALAATAVLAVATPPGLPPGAPGGIRRSRFLAGGGGGPKLSPPPSFYDCVKKLPSICLSPGSPGATCCSGQCVDTEASVAHCGNCNKKCKYAETCCAGKCVDLLNDKKNCGECDNRCAKKCNFGLCDYAG